MNTDMKRARASIARTLRHLRHASRSHAMIPKPSSRDMDIDEANLFHYDLSGEWTLEVEIVERDDSTLITRQPVLSPRYRLGWGVVSGGGYWDPPDYDYVTGEWADCPFTLLVAEHAKALRRAIGEDLMVFDHKRDERAMGKEDWT